MRDLFSWALVLTLTISPLMAENAPVLNLNTRNRGEHFDNSLLGTSILMSLPARPAAALPAMPNSNDNKAPGVNKSIIIGLLILAGTTAAVILLWPHGHDKPQPVVPPAPVTPVPMGTILAAGTPVVNSPNQ